MKISSWWRELTGIAKRSTFLSEMRRHIPDNYLYDHGNRLFPDERRQSGGATGGGVSDVFNLPNWQAHARIPPSANPGGRIGRGVPDVAGDAAPVTGYRVLVDGKQFTIGGTSAVAPLWAGLLALVNQKLGHSVGYLNPGIYGLPPSSGAFHEIGTGNNDITGKNGLYPARSGWDACTGWGSPNGAKLLSALSGP